MVRWDFINKYYERFDILLLIFVVEYYVIIRRIKNLFINKTLALINKEIILA